MSAAAARLWHTEDEPFNDQYASSVYPMLENPEKLQEMVGKKRERNLPIYSLRRAQNIFVQKTQPYADEWKDHADKLVG